MKRKKGNGYEEVKQYVLRRLHERPHPDDPFVRIVGEEIGQAVGITSQTANEHVRALVRHGVFHRERRCYFSESRASAPHSSSPPPSVSPCSVNLPMPAMPSGDDPQETETTWTLPMGNLLRIFTDGSGNVHLVFAGVRQPSQNDPVNLQTTFTESQDGFCEGSRTFCEGSQHHKKEYQERKEKTEKKKIVSELSRWIDVKDELYQRYYRQASTLFDKYGAGLRNGTSPMLVSRFVAGFMLKVPLVNFEELEEQLKEAQKEHLEYMNYNGYGRRQGIRKPFVRIANYLKKCFEADGWEWTKVHPPFEQRLKRAHQSDQQAFTQVNDPKTIPPAHALTGQPPTLPVAKCLTDPAQEPGGS